MFLNSSVDDSQERPEKATNRDSVEDVKHLIILASIITTLRSSIERPSRVRGFCDNYPDYIVDEFLELLGNCFEGQIRSQIDNAVEEIAWMCGVIDVGMRDRTLEVIRAGA